MDRLRSARDKATVLQFHASGAPVGVHPRVAGLFKFCPDKTQVQALQKWHLRAKHAIAIDNMVPWGSGPQDARRRGYAFLAQSGLKQLEQAGIRISCEGAYEESNDSDNIADAVHRKTIRQACAALPSAQVTGKMATALNQIIERVRSCVHPKYKVFCSPNQLACMQPNLHNQALSLPLHLDSPLHDGFGVVIVTVSISGDAEIVLLDDGDDCEVSMSWSFQLREGEVYVISGNARNKCTHGVIAASPMRESLNLRLGLHTRDFANEEIYKHWPS
jgi:hypothetical protein